MLSELEFNQIWPLVKSLQRCYKFFCQENKFHRELYYTNMMYNMMSSHMNETLFNLLNGDDLCIAYRNMGITGYFDADIHGVYFLVALTKFASIEIDYGTYIALLNGSDYADIRASISDIYNSAVDRYEEYSWASNPVIPAALKGYDKAIYEEYMGIFIPLLVLMKESIPSIKDKRWITNFLKMNDRFLSESEPVKTAQFQKVKQAAVDSCGDVRTLVTGVPFQCPDDWEKVLDSLDESSNLYLIKEPDNPKDSLAIAAYLNDRRIGYVSSSDNGKIWLYLTDEKMPCKFLQRYNASFKISFKNPRIIFEGLAFEEIYQDKDGQTEDFYADFDIPFLSNSNDQKHNWFDDQTYITDLEKAIPDFRRKLASRLIILVGRKNSEGQYCYYLPYFNKILADIQDVTIKSLIDKFGFVIALPDVPVKTEQGGIFMDLHVTYLTGLIFSVFDKMHQSEFVFHLTEQ
jgi:hypothetical protein